MFGHATDSRFICCNFYGEYNDLIENLTGPKIIKKLKKKLPTVYLNLAQYINKLVLNFLMAECYMLFSYFNDGSVSRHVIWSI